MLILVTSIGLTGPWPTTTAQAQGNVIEVSGDVTLVVLADKAPNAEWSHDLDLVDPLDISVCQSCPDEPVARLLGAFDHGDELVFRLRVTKPDNTSYELLSTDSSSATVNLLAENAWRISWEDGGGVPAGDMIVAVAPPELIGSRLFGLGPAFLGLAGDPVEVSTGNLVESRTDLVGGSGAYGLDWTRTYNSRDTRVGVVGRGWSTPVDQELTELGGDYFEWRMADGRTVVFVPEGSDSWGDVEAVQGELVESGSGMAVQYHSGERIEFNGQGEVVRWCSGVPDWANQPTDWCSRSDPLGGEYVDVDRSTPGMIKLNNFRAGQAIWLSLADSLVTTAQAKAGSTTFASASYARVGEYAFLQHVNLPAGGRHTYTYTATDSNGVLTKIEERIDDSGLNRTVLEVNYDDAGRAEWQRMENGDVLTLDYSVPGETAALYDVDGPGGEPAEEYVYSHTAGRLEGLQDPQSSSIAKSWDDGQLSEFSSRRGADWLSEYDPTTGRLVKRTYPNPATGELDSGIFEEWTYVSTTDSRVSEYRNREGEVTCYGYTGGLAGDDESDMVPATVTTACGTPRAATTTMKSEGDLVIESTDADGVKTCMTYATGTRRLETTTQFCGTPAAMTTTYSTSFSSGGWVETVTSPKWGGGTASVSSTYDAAGRLVSVSDPIAGNSVWTYYPDGRLRTYVDEAGARTCHSYAQTSGGSTHTIVALNSYGVGSCASPPAGSRTTVETYDRANRLTKVEGPDGAVTEYTYGPLGRLDTESRLVSTNPTTWYHTRFVYDDDGNLTKTVKGTNPNNAAETVETVYDLWGRAIVKLGPAGEPGAPQARVETDYDHEGRVLAVREMDGATTIRTTSMEYWENGLLWKTHNPMDLPDVSDDAVETRNYTPAGRLQTVTDYEGGVTEYIYEPGTGRIDRSWLPRQRASSTAAYLDYEWDAHSGLLASLTTPGGIMTSYGYDEAGRRTTVTTPNPEGSGTVTTTTVYTARDEVAQVSSPLNATDTAVTLWFYTPFGEVDLVVNPNAGGDPGNLGANVAYGYDGRGNRISRTRWVDEGSGLTARTETWTYNLADQLVRHEGLDYDPASDNANTWAYDTSTGELLEAKVGSAIDGSLRVTRNSYYNSGAVKQVCFDEDPIPEPACDDGTSIRVAYEYNAVGQRTKMTDARGDTVYTYADKVNLTHRAEPGGVSTAWQWNQRSQPAVTTYPNNGQTRYHYYDDGALKQMDLNFFGVWVPIAEYVLNADGQVLDELMGGYSRHWEYENGTTLPSTYTQLVDGSTSNTDLAYDRAGRLTTVVDNVASHTATYTYDLASQLLQATGSTPGSSDDWTYTYGDDGRRLTQTTFGGTTTYQHGPDGRIASATIGSTTTNYTYDKAGRLTSNGTHTFSYDPRGLLIEMNPTGNNLYDHRNYDGDGNLSEHDIGVTNVFEARMRAAAWDPTQPVINPLSWEGTLEVAGDPPTIYTSHSAHLYGRARIVTGQTGGTSWYGYDHLGSVIDTDTNDVPDRYSPYGQPLNVSFWPSYYGYRGEAQTHHTIHLRNRTYDPNTGQFITRDPLDGVDGTPTVANPYHYVANDPINKVDPTGLREQDCGLQTVGCRFVVLDVNRAAGGGDVSDGARGIMCYSIGSMRTAIQSGAQAAGMDVRMVYAVFAYELGEDPCDETFGDVAGGLGLSQGSRGPSNFPREIWGDFYDAHAQELARYWQSIGYGGSLSKDEFWRFLTNPRLSAYATALRLGDLMSDLGSAMKATNAQFVSMFDVVEKKKDPKAIFYLESALLGVGWYGGKDAQTRMRTILSRSPADLLHAGIEQYRNLAKDPDRCYTNGYGLEFLGASATYSEPYLSNAVFKMC